MKLLRSLSYGLLVFAFAGGLLAQTTSRVDALDRYQSGTVAPPGVITSIVTKGDSVLERHTFDPNEEMQVIVQFQSPPVCSVYHVQGTSPALGAAALSTVQSQIESDHTRFHADLLRLEGSVQTAPSARSALKGATGRVSAEYRKVLNGVALRSRRWLIDRLRTLPYVKSISPDRQVQALDAASNHQIGADSVWAKYGVTGAGVRIGVIDTGIDYMHPDLGGGFGPGHKVAGGWDFVNNDADPSDDNGHGTHVAGIAAADGLALKGVAPKATLYAYKVLDAHGDGYDAEVIAALEHAADPDGDPFTDDHLDIVNLSLGSSGGDPTDPVSQAVDNTTRVGVLCVVSAGNNGPGPQTINSPGCATSALTVGACDASDAVSTFSSCGPTNASFSIKPDLVAPGVSISSTIPGAAYQTLSGTSMAAPHATGAAALLKQLHPHWSPDLLKSALVGNAKDLGQDLWRQGRGRLDIMKAARARILAFPQSLSFGLDLLSQSHWSHVDTVTIVNLTDSVRDFTVSGTTGLPAGFSLSADPPTFSVASHESRSILISLDLDNNSVQLPGSDLQDVNGLLTLLSAQEDSLKIPWAVTLGTYLEITFHPSASAIPIFCRFTRFSDGKVFSAHPGDSTYTGPGVPLRVLLPSDTYEVIVQLYTWDTIDYGKSGCAWVVRDSVVVRPAASITVSDSDASYRIGALLKDEQGALIDSTGLIFYAMRLTSKRTQVGVGTSWAFPIYRRLMPDKVSPLSANFVYDYYCSTPVDQPRVYTYAASASPVVHDCVADVQPSDFQKREVQYRTHAGEATLKAAQTLEFTRQPNTLVTFFDSSAPGLTAPFHQVWYAMGHPVKNFPFGGVLINHRLIFDGSSANPFLGGTDPPRLVTPNQSPGVDGVLRSSLILTNNPVQESRSKELIYGLGPHHYFGRMDNGSPTLMRLRTNTWAGMFLFSSLAGAMYVPLFLNQAMDFEPGWVNLTLRDSTGRLVNAGTSETLSLLDYLGATMLDASLNMDLPKAGRYTLQVWDPASYVLSLKGAAIVDLTFDTRQQDPNPPAMSSFNILGADSEYTDMLQPGEEGYVTFRVSDAETGLRSVGLSYHTDSSRSWVPLPLTNLGDLYQAQLPGFRSSDGLVSFRVLVSDASNNSLDYRAEPALHIGPDYSYTNRAPQKLRLLTPNANSFLQLYEVVRPVLFSWESALDRDGWDTLSYTFHIRGSGLGTSFDRWLRDTAVSLNFMDYLSPDESYRWWMETTDGHVTVSSDTATFRTSSTILSASGREIAPPKMFVLAQNYPNPFNPTTTIGYELPRESRVLLKVYNLLGQEVITLVDGEKPAGRYAVTVDGRGFASGIYVYRLVAISSTRTKSKADENFTAVRKFLLLR
jgi:hypothetical protein